MKKLLTTTALVSAIALSGSAYAEANDDYGFKDQRNFVEKVFNYNQDLTETQEHARESYVNKTEKVVNKLDDKVDEAEIRLRTTNNITATDKAQKHEKIKMLEGQISQVDQTLDKAMGVPEEEWETYVSKINSSLEEIESEYQQVNASLSINMEERESFINRTEAKLDNLQADIVALKNQAAKSTDESYDKAVVELEQMANTIEDNLEDLRDTSVEEWEQAKASVENGIDKLKDEYDELVNGNHKS